MEHKNYYDILGISKNATSDEIKKGYRSMAKKYHPDVNKSPDAEQRIKEINQANDILSNPEKRKIYDQYGQSAANQNFNQQTNYQQGPYQGYANMEDLFEAFFRQNAANAQRQRQYRQNNPQPQAGSSFFAFILRVMFISFLFRLLFFGI